MRQSAPIRDFSFVGIIVNNRVTRRFVKGKKEGAGCSATKMSDIEDEPPSVLLPCTICSRTFKPEVLERHVKVCEKTASKKRRVFDSFKNRVSGTELEEFLGPAPLPGQVIKRPAKSPVKKKNPSKWKETHENLIAVLRAARGAQPPPETIIDSTKHGVNEQCPSCNRFFGPRAFDRHVEFCKEKTARIKVTPSKVSQAQERLEARTKYRAPLSVKPKLTTKEKYSPMLPRKESNETCTVSSTSAKTSPPIPTLNRNAKNISSNSAKSNVSRSLERHRSVSPKKNVVSSSKSTNKNEHSANKSSNPPKIKENLKEPELLRPKTGSKNTAQEKLRSCKVKITHSEDEYPSKLSKSKQRTRNKTACEFGVPSDDESIATLESEPNESQTRKTGKTKSKWSSSESIVKTPLKANIKIKIDDRHSDDEKIVLRSGRGIKSSREKQKTEDVGKSNKKSNKQPKHQINDLSVNDESFGIFVAPCGRPASSTPSHTSIKLVRDSPDGIQRNSGRKEKTRKVEEVEQPAAKIEKVPRKKIDKPKTKVINVNENHQPLPPPACDSLSQSPTRKEAKAKKVERTNNSKIPKPRQDGPLRMSREKEYEEKIDTEEKPMVTTEEEKEVKREDIELENRLDDGLDDASAPCRPENLSPNVTENKRAKLKAKAKKWRNIAEMSTEDLLHMTDDFDLPQNEDNEKLSESAIWEIAAEQFLKSEESVQSASVMSVDSLNENPSEHRLIIKESEKKGDDFIVLHVTDPDKMNEIDATMKLSLSEPCFPCSDDRGQKGKDLNMADVVVFASYPSEIQKYRTKRKNRIKAKKARSAPKLQLAIREKTFLANDMPKAKRRRLIGDLESDIRLNFETLAKNSFKGFSMEECEEKKKKLIEALMKRREKVYRWHIANNFHIKFLEEFRTCVEEDLKELKNLSMGKKRTRKSYAKKFKAEKYRKMKEKVSKKSTVSSTKKMKSDSNKKFEYFEIDLNDDDDQGIPEAEPQPENDEVECEPFEREPEKISVKKFECRDVSRDRGTKFKPENKLEISDSSLELCDVNVESENLNFSPRKPEREIYLVDNVAEENSSDRNRTSTPNKELTESDEIKSVSPISHCDLEVLNDDTPYEKIKSSETMMERFSHQTNNYALNRCKSRDTITTDSLQALNNPNGSLENIEEEDEEEEKVAQEIREAERKDDIEIEDFIVFKPNAKKLLSKEDICLDELFPKPRKIAETVKTEPSTTAVRLGYTANSVYDLKSNGEKNLKDFAQISNRSNSRMLQKRLKKGSSRLPQLNLCSNDEKKENSMISLIELWKNKKQNLSGREIGCNDLVPKTKVKLMPVGKLAPLSAKNPFQIKSDARNDSYDPFKQAERQMLALLSWPSTTDIKTTKDFSPKTKQKPNSNSNLQTSPTSAFSKYTETNDKSCKISKSPGGARKNLSETFVTEDLTSPPTLNRLEKPTYEAADDWEQIFEKHFDLNRNEMTDKMTRTVKSALDDLLKNTVQNNYDNYGKGKLSQDRHRTPLKNRNNLSDNSIIEEILYTSTPKQNSKTNYRDKTFDLNQKSYEKSLNLTRGLRTPPVDSDDAFGQTDEKKNRNSGISLSGLSFSSQISDTTLADEEVMRSNLEIVGKAAAAAAVSRTPRRKYARSQSVFEERNRMLFAKTYDPNATSSDEENVEESLPKICEKPGTNKSPSRNSYPKTHPSHFYRSQSVFDGRCKGDGDHTDEGDHMSSPEANRNRKAKLSGDSAYSSLNRRSPRQSLTSKNNVQEDRLSSGESDTSLPIVGNDYGQKKSRKPGKEVDDAGKRDKPVKMSKFCHECGSKYPVAVAKFCCECGVRRLVI